MLIFCPTVYSTKSSGEPSFSIWRKNFPIQNVHTIFSFGIRLHEYPCGRKVSSFTETYVRSITQYNCKFGSLWWKLWTRYYKTQPQYDKPHLVILELYSEIDILPQATDHPTWLKPISYFALKRKLTALCSFIADYETDNQMYDLHMFADATAVANISITNTASKITWVHFLYAKSRIVRPQ